MNQKLRPLRTTAILSLATLLAPLTSAQIVMVSNLGNESPGGAQTQSGLWHGSAFTTDNSSYTFNSVTFDFQNGNEFGNFFVSINADSAGKPGSQLTNGLLSGPAIPLNAAPAIQVAYSASDTITLSPNSTYWFVTGITSGSGIYTLKVSSDLSESSPSGWTIGNNRAFSSDQAATWSLDNGSTIPLFSVTATSAIPEPGSYAAAIGLIFLVGVATHRRWRGNVPRSELQQV